jgi:transcriptional repressor NrdR
LKTTFSGVFYMISCPLCGNEDSKVIDSRSMDNGIRRRRQCIKCKGRFTTYERILARTMYVIKKDGRREEFSRDKLALGIRKACEKRPLPTGTIDKVVDSIEIELYQLGKSEISSTIIGDRVIDKLRELDHIAYIRFASVYREFTDISTLKEAVDTLVEKRGLVPPSGQLFLLSPDQLESPTKTKRRK